MKKIFTLIVATSVAFGMTAKDYVLDLNSAELSYVTKANAQVWNDTYNEANSTLYVAPFNVSHLMGGTSYGGSYWDGFTAVKCADSSEQTDWITYQWGVMPTQTVNDPYLLGYYSAWTTSCNVIVTDEAKSYAAKSIKVAIPAYTYYACKNGTSMNSAFTKEGDNTKLVVTGYQDDGTTKTVDIALAEYTDGAFKALTEWTNLDLTPLGKVYMLEFTMTSTDVGAWGINTPTYFAVKDLVMAEEASGITDVAGKEVASVKYVDLNGRQSDQPFAGVNIMVTTYTDGSRSTAKVLR